MGQNTLGHQRRHDDRAKHRAQQNLIARRAYYQQQQLQGVDNRGALAKMIVQGKYKIAGSGDNCSAGEQH
jgi:hypothetical protein